MKELKKVRNFLEEIFINGQGTGLYYLFYGRLLQYLSGMEMSCPMSPDVIREYFDKGYLLEELVIGGDSFEFPICGMDQGAYAYDIKADYHFCGMSEMDDYEKLASYSTLFVSGQDIYDLFTDHEGNMVLNGKTKKQKEKYRHLKYGAGGLWDAFCHYAPDYFCSYSGHLSEASKDELLEMYLYGGVDPAFDYDEAFQCQFSLRIQNAAVDAWLSFLKGSAVSRRDRKESAEVFGTLMSFFDEFTSISSKITFLSHPEGDCAFGYPCGRGNNKIFEMYIVQANDAYFNGYSITDYLQMGLIPPDVMIAMADVVIFLENMDNKYHFLSGKGKNERRKKGSKKIIA